MARRRNDLWCDPDTYISIMPHLPALCEAKGEVGAFTWKYPFALWHLYLNACPTRPILAEALISGQL